MTLRVFTRIFLLIALAFPVGASAATVQTASDIFVPEVQIIHGNTYLAGGTIRMYGVVTGDLVVAGSDVEVGGMIEEDALVLGGSVNMFGYVKGDVRVLGGSVRVSGAVDGDVVLVGGTLYVEEGVQVSGDIIVIGGRVVLANDTERHARVIAGTTHITGAISGSANITTRNLVLSDSATIAGNIVYFAPLEARKSSGTQLTGTLHFNNISEMSQAGVIDRAVVTFLHFWTVLRFVTTLLLTFLIIYMFRVLAQQTARYVTDSFLSTTFVGFGVLLLTPLAGVIIALSLILLPIAMLIGLYYIILLILAPAIAGIALGALLKKAFSKDGVFEISFRTAALGVIVLTLVRFVPVIGDVVHIVFFVAALGAMWRYMYTNVRHRELRVLAKPTE